jgi:hypothetical protein
MISGARRPRARCAVSNRRLAEATAACKAPSAAHRTAVGGVGSAIGDGALVAKDRAHGRAPWPSVRYFKKATVPGARGSGQPKASASGQGEACASGQNCHPRRDAKNANADRLVTLHAKFISSHGWLAQGKLMAPTFLVAIDQGGE